MDRPLVSILIPCYNSEDWVSEAIESALAQSYPNKEVLVCNDGSLDNSAQIIAQYEPGIQCIEFSSNQGGQRARNALIEHSKGSWVQFLDADDYLEPLKVETDIKHFAQNATTEIILSQTPREHSADGAREPFHTLPSEKSPWACWLAWKMPQTGGFLWKKETLQKIGRWHVDWRNCQDYEIALRALKSGARWSSRKDSPAESLAVYRQWSDDTVSKNNLHSVIQNRTQLTKDALAFLESSKALTDAHITAARISFFEMTRAIAATDIPAAQAYLEGIPEHYKPLVSGPAAPLNYRIASRILGIIGAEKLAKLLRK